VRILALFRCLLLGAIAFMATNATAAKTILVFGDSLSAGYGIAQDRAWPSLLASRLREKQLDYTVVNASISGETTSGGRARLDAALAKYAPNIVIIVLGSNDGLRGLPIATIRGNLLSMIDSAQKRKASLLLVGQRLPPNYGAYAREFDALFGELARARKTAKVDFLLADVIARRELFQADNMHPTAEAQPLLLETVWKGLAPLLK